MDLVQGPRQLVTGRCVCFDRTYAVGPRALCSVHDYTDRGGVPLMKRWDLFENRTDDFVAWSLWSDSAEDELDFPCTCPLTGCDRYEFDEPERGCEYCFEAGPCGEYLPPMPRR